LLPQAEILVLHGCMASDPELLVEHGLTPVLNGADDVAAWAAHARRMGRRLRAALQVDTGMARMGMTLAQADAFAADTDLRQAVDICLVLSHLACAEEQDNPFNAQQRAAFERMRRCWPGVRASLANSSGIFLGPGYHYDLVRPGAALHGVAPVAGAPNPMLPVVRLQARVIQVHDVAAGAAVGYGRTWTATRRTRIATVSVGYADGLPRSASSRACAWFEGVPLPVVGRVSMDSTTLDVSQLAADRLHAGSLVDLLDAHHGVDALATEAGTIGYEILTSLGHRYARNYLGA
jgi:alanine racemase